MVRKLDPCVKVLRHLEQRLDANRLELLRIESYPGASWDDTRDSYRLVISRLEAAIAKVEADGLPDGYAVTHGLEEAPRKKKERVIRGSGKLH